MIQSMTGFGLGGVPLGTAELRVEVRTVNHKFCEVKPRLPIEFAPFEVELVKRVKERLRRGAVDVFVKRGEGPSAARTPRIDLDAARVFVATLDRAAEALGLAKTFGTAELARIEGLVTYEAETLAPEALSAALFEAADRALDAVVAMRRREGEALAKDLAATAGRIEAHAAAIAKLSPEAVDGYRQRLEARLAELTRTAPVDPQRLAQEVAIFADRVDIAEELTRLASHLAQFDEMLESDEPTGRRLEFLVQEIHREVNTTGSKSQSIEIAQRVVAMKAEIERLREQVANVE